MATETLRAMALGGMRDHIGGGFHRYSVDAEWRVPHFEKMLYDQAQLVLAYLEAAQATGDEFFAAVAEDTLAYVMRDITDRDGGFYLGGRRRQRSAGAGRRFRPRTRRRGRSTSGRTPRSRARSAPTPRSPGGGSASSRTATRRTIRKGSSRARTCSTSRSRSTTIAERTGATPADVTAALGRVRTMLFERARRPSAAASRRQGADGVERADDCGVRARGARARRTPAASALPRRRHTRRRLHPRRAVARRRSPLLRRYRDGDAAIDAYAEDYASLICGLLELFQADGEPAWLEWARDAAGAAGRALLGSKDGGWFSTTGRDPSVLLRLKEDYDGAEPAASSVSVLNLLTLAHSGSDEEAGAKSSGRWAASDRASAPRRASCR